MALLTPFKWIWLFFKYYGLCVWDCFGEIYRSETSAGERLTAMAIMYGLAFALPIELLVAAWYFYRLS